MLVPKSLVGLFAMVVVGACATLAWQVHTSVALKPAANEDAAAAEVRTLEQQVAAESRKLEAAEARLSEVLKTADDVRTGRSHPAGSGRATSGAEGAIDIVEIGNAAVEKGRALMKEGKLQEALDLYLATYREVRTVRPGNSACQSMMSGMKYLARTFPPALTALVQLRDEAMGELQTKPDWNELIFEIALLNQRLEQGERTLVLYDALPPNDHQRGSIASIARDTFIQARRYPDALLGKPFGQMFVLVDSGAQHLAKQNEPARQTIIRKGIIEQTATNIEVLAGAGKATEAEQLTQKLLAFDNTPTTRALIEQHRARAAGSSR